MIGGTFQIDAIGVEIAGVVTAGNAKVNASIGQNIQCRDLLGKTDWIVQCR
jgi:hypothetical protein